MEGFLSNRNATNSPYALTSYQSYNQSAKEEENNLKEIEAWGRQEMHISLKQLLLYT
jgi:hypothetical protein